MSLDKTKNIILKKIDHEFVLPLAVIDSSIQMERLDGHDSEFLDVVSSAKTALHIAYKNIKYLLSQKSDEKTVFELTDFIKQKAKKLTPDARAYGVLFEVSCDDTKSEILIDESELDILVENIFTICAKYSEQNNIVKASICQNNDNTISLAVKTRGKKAEAMAESFLKFRHNIEENDGIGLGIYVCRLICENNSATLDITKGSDEITVTVSFLGYKK